MHRDEALSMFDKIEAVVSKFIHKQEGAIRVKANFLHAEEAPAFSDIFTNEGIIPHVTRSDLQKALLFQSS